MSARWPLPAGTPVVTPDGLGTVVESVMDGGYEVTEAGWEHGPGGPPVSYRVRLGDGRVIRVAEVNVTVAPEAPRPGAGCER